MLKLFNRFLLLLALATMAAMSLADWTPAEAQQQPCQWDYTAPDNISTASYCGNINVAGSINSGGSAVTPLFVVPESFGGGSTVPDNTSAITQALAKLTAAGGGVLYFGQSGNNYNIASASLSSSFNVPAKTTIQCAPGVSIAITGSSVTATLFQVTNPNNVYVGVDCTIIGNSQSGGDGSIGAVAFQATNTATGNLYNYGSPRLTLKNFKQSAWIEVYNQSSFGLYNGNFDGFDCYSQSGNTFNGSVQGSGAFCLDAVAQLSNNGGIISQLHWRDGYVDATYIKGCGTFFNTFNVLIDNGYCLGAGTGLPSGLHYGGYLFYDLSTGFESNPTNFTVSNTKIISPLNFGIYCVEAQNANFTGNYISGLQDVAGSASFATATIQMSQCSGTARSNTITGNYGWGIWNAVGDGYNVDISNNQIVGNLVGVNTPAGGILHSTSIGVSSGNTAITNYIGNIVTNNAAGSQALALQSNSASNSYPGTVNIVGGSYVGRPGLRAFDGSGTTAYAGKALNISGNAYFNGNTTSYLINASGSSAPITIDGAILDGSTSTGTGAYGLEISSNTNTKVSNVLFLNWINPTYVIDAVGTCFAMQGLSFQNVSSQYAPSTSLGVQAPTCTARQNSYVQNLLPTELGTTGLKYIINAWVNTSGSTTWLPERTLTGN